ncbi:MAG: excinuclease ABC subunit UvrC [Pseudomonadota bacterium]
MNEKVKNLINEMPSSPGVYMFKSAEERVIYVGKAKNLRDRLKSYVQYEKSSDPKNYAVYENIDGLEIIRTKNEFDALLLESNLIKKYKPRYNILLKDDKSYPYIKIDLRAEWPKFEVVRKFSEDKAIYFGPYTSTRVLNNIVSTINKAFPFRKCSDVVFANAKRPCLNYEMRLCSAPCQGLIKKRDYMGIIQGAMTILKGNVGDVIEELEKEMTLAADNLDFEEASSIKSRLKSLYMLLSGQNVILPNDRRNIDVISIAEHEKGHVFNILYVRNGMLLGQSNVFVSGGNIKDCLNRFLVDHYIKNIRPDLVVVPFDIEDQAVTDFLKTKVIFKPAKDIKKLKDIGEENLAQYINGLSIKHNRWDVCAKELQKKFKLADTPRTVECYDMSNISGQYAVGVKVFFENGVPAKNLYRKYKIRGVFKGDDLKMMREVLTRRLSHINDEPLADIILIDGGRTQLGAVSGVINGLGVNVGVLVSIAKDKTRTKGLSKDKLYLEQNKNVREIKLSTDALNFIKMIRDEAHRFAISYYRNFHSKVVVKL